MHRTFASPARRRLALLGLAVAASALLPGCAGYYYGEKYGPTLGSLMRESLVARNTEATKQLLKQAQPKEGEGQADAAPPALTIVVQPLKALDGSGDTAFARLTGEQLAGALAAQGQRVVMLPAAAPGARQPPLDALLLERQAQALLTGRYAVSRGQVFVSLKLLRPDASVAAAHDYAVPLDDDVRSLLGLR